MLETRHQEAPVVSRGFLGRREGVVLSFTANVRFARWLGEPDAEVQPLMLGFGGSVALWASQGAVAQVDFKLRHNLPHMLEQVRNPEQLEELLRRALRGREVREVVTVTHLHDRDEVRLYFFLARKGEEGGLQQLWRTAAAAASARDEFERWRKIVEGKASTI